MSPQKRTSKPQNLYNLKPLSAGVQCARSTPAPANNILHHHEFLEKLLENIDRELNGEPIAEIGISIEDHSSEKLSLSQINSVPENCNNGMETFMRGGRAQDPNVVALAAHEWFSITGYAPTVQLGPGGRSDLEKTDSSGGVGDDEEMLEGRSDLEKTDSSGAVGDDDEEVLGGC